MVGGFRGLLEQETSTAKSLGPTLRRLASYFRPYWLVLLVVLVMMIGNAWVQVIVPMLTGQAVDCFLSPVVTGGGAAAPTVGDAPSAAQANCAVVHKLRYHLQYTRAFQQADNNGE